MVDQRIDKKVSGQLTWRIYMQIRGIVSNKVHNKDLLLKNFL